MNICLQAYIRKASVPCLDCGQDLPVAEIGDRLYLCTGPENPDEPGHHDFTDYSKANTR